MIKGFEINKGDKLNFDYTNWQGVTGRRTAVVERIWFGSTEWHPDAGVLIEATDCEKNVVRYFYAMDMTDIKKVA